MLGWLFVGCFLFLGAWSDPKAYAGCGAHGSSSVGRIDVGSSTWELALPMYREYIGGKWSYSFVSPQPPCDGPGCRAKPSCRPIDTAIVLFEASFVFGFSEGHGYWLPTFPGRGWDEIPKSEFAFRGRLAPPEPPPKV